MQESEALKNQQLAHVMAQLLLRISRHRCLCTFMDVDSCPSCLARGFIIKYLEDEKKETEQ